MAAFQHLNLCLVFASILTVNSIYSQVAGISSGEGGNEDCVKGIHHLTHHETIQKSVNQIVSLDCEAENFTSFEWFKDEKRFPFGQFEKSFMIDKEGAVLSFMLSSTEFTGDYLCCATSEEGYKIKKFSVKTKKRMWSKQPFPNVDTCNNITVRLGGTALFNCSFCGGRELIDASLTWWKKKGESWVQVADLNITRSKFLTQSYSGFCAQRHHQENSIELSTGVSLEIQNVEPFAYGVYRLTINGSLDGVTYTVTLSPELPGSILLKVVVVLVIIFFFSFNVGAFYTWRQISLDAKLFWKSKFGKIEKGDHEYDAYIAYDTSSEKDRKFALKIMEYLENNNYIVYLLEVHSSPGENAVGAIIEAMERSFRIVLIITPTFVHSSHVALEASLTRDQLLRNKAKVIPLLHPDVRVDKLGGHLKALVSAISCIKTENEEVKPHIFYKQLLHKMPKTQRKFRESSVR